MEIFINKQKYFAFFNYTQKGQVVTSNCGQTFTGWYHDAVIAAKRVSIFETLRVRAHLCGSFSMILFGMMQCFDNK